jgi:hypothetical protein
MPQMIIDSREPIDKILDIVTNKISSYALFPNFSIEALEYGDYYLENGNKTRLFICNSAVGYNMQRWLCLYHLLVEHASMDNYRI